MAKRVEKDKMTINKTKGNMYQDDRILRYETEIPGPFWLGILTTSCKEEEVLS